MEPVTDIQIPGYRIEAAIGKGGMGVVYKATHLALDRVVAIKVLPVALASDEEFVTGFAAEAKTAAKLNHPNIVSIYDFGSFEGGCFISMQYVEGRTLKQLLETHRPPIDDTIAILSSVASALDYAHGQGVVHRDIKPANIMLRANGGAMIMDFGLAGGTHVLDSSAVEGSWGTPQYMSPE